MDEGVAAVRLRPDQTGANRDKDEILGSFEVQIRNWGQQG